MNISIGKLILSVVLCMIFCGLGVLVWASGYYIVDLTGLKLEIIDFFALILFFCGFISCCIVNNNDNEAGRKC